MMRRRFDLRHKPQTDPGLFTDPLCGFYDQCEFKRRIDLDGIYFGVNSCLNLPDLFTGSIKDDLLAIKAGLQSFPQLAAGIYLNIGTCIFYGAKNPHCRHRLGGITQLEGTVDELPSSL